MSQNSDTTRLILIPSYGHIQSDRVTPPRPPINTAGIERGGTNDRGTAGKSR